VPPVTISAHAASDQQVSAFGTSIDMTAATPTTTSVLPGYPSRCKAATEWGTLRFVEKCARHYHLVKKDSVQPVLQIGTSDVPAARRLREGIPDAILDILRGDEGAPSK
jgi:hypothetical protein